MRGMTEQVYCDLDLWKLPVVTNQQTCIKCVVYKTTRASVSDLSPTA